MRRAALLFMVLFSLVVPPSRAFSATAPKSDPTLIALQGAVRVASRANGPAVTPVVRSMRLGAGYVVATGANGLADLLFPNGFTAKAYYDTVLHLSAPVPDRLTASRGKVVLRVPHGLRTSIEGPAARAVLRGTELMLEVADDGTTTVSVAEGEVQFANDQGSVLVRDGEQSRARVGEAPSAPVAVNLPILLEWTNALLPPLVPLERRYVAQDPKARERAAAEAERLPAPGERALREADVLHDQRRLVEALAAYDRLVEQGPPGDAAWEARLAERRGHTLLPLGRLDDAEAAFRRAMDAAPGNAAKGTARAGLAMTLMARDQLDGARAEATAAVAAVPPGDPGAAWSNLVLGVVETRRRDLGAAGAALERAQAADPADGQVRAWQSYVLRSKNDLAGAEEQARKAVELGPDLPASHQSLADVYLLRSRAAEAGREAREAVRLDPLSAAAHVSLANAELMSGRVGPALREAHKGVALDPRSGPAHYTLAAAAAAQRDYAAAERYLRQALALNPDLLDARSLLGRVLVARGKEREAEQVAQETLAQSPDLPSARASLGQVYRLMGRLREAAREYEAALAAAPRNGLYHVEAAQLYLDLNDMPAALRHAQEGVFLLPGSSEAHAILGLVYDRQEAQEQAVREYQEAISLSPENSLARLGLVTAFTPRSRDLGAASGRDRLREQAQALLRDPAVLQQVFKPGVTSELAGGLGSDSREEQRYLHRGQFLQGRVHDLSVASRFSDDGYRPNSPTSGRLLQTNVAIQATPRSQALLQVAGTKDSGGLPESEQRPAPNAYYSRRQNEYRALTRHDFGGGTHLWFESGVRAVRITRTNPDLPPRPIRLPGQVLPGMKFYRFTQRANEHVTELRLDHRVGRHLLSYGLADLRLNARLFNFEFAQTGNSPAAAAGSLSPALRILGTSFPRDFLQYFQEEYRIGDRGSLVAGAQWLSRDDRNFQTASSPSLSPPTLPLTASREEGHDTLPYAALTYRLGVHSLVRVTGNKTQLRPSNPLLAPSEAFIIGEPIPLAFAGGPAPASLPFASGPSQAQAETYELDYEHRFSAHTFAKLFWQRSLARNFIVQPSLEQQFIPTGFLIETARAQIAGVRLEHQITRFLSGFTRWSYLDVVDRTPVATGVLADPQNPGPNPSLGLQVPFVPRWRGLVGFNYVDRSGTKLRLVANLIGRRFTDVGTSPIDPDTFGAPTFDRGKKRPATGPDVLLDLRLAKEPSVRMEVSLTVTNLLNATFPDNILGFPTRGRTWLLSIARRY